MFLKFKLTVMKNKFFILLVGTLFLSIHVKSQRVLDVPVDYVDFNKPVVSSLDNYPIDHENSTRAQQWVVYSDRENNVTYRTQNAQQRFKTVGFLEKFYVTEESGNYLHIFKDNNIIPTDIELSPSAQDYGWIHKNNLILYRNCLKNEKKVNQKGMLVNTLETIEQAADRPDQESILVGFYNDPNLSERAEFQSTLYQIFHIYKKQGNAVLLGRGHEIRGDITETIMGWAPFDRITAWKHRIAFEPNWEEEAWKERKANNTKATVFFGQSKCENYINNPEMLDGPLWSADPIAKMSSDNYYQREIGQWRRFPVLRYVNNNCFEVGAVGDIKTQYKVVSSSEDAKLQANIESGIQKLQQKNILFVIDGTRSMTPYFKSVSNAVARSMEAISLNGSNSYPPKFGCVIYRDNAYKLIEKMNFNEDYNQIVNFLNGIQAGDQNDPDHAEAVNYGLEEALRMLPEGETNFIVLIGDAGNHTRNDRSYVSNSRIEHMIAIKQPHFLAFQVSNRSNEGYQAFKRFASDAETILTNSANSIRQSFDLSVNISGNTQLNQEIDNSNYKYSKLINSPIVGNILECKPGERVQPEKLEEEIIKLVSFSEGMVSSLGKEIAAVGSGRKLVMDNSASGSNEYEQYVDNFNGILLNFFNNLNLSPQQAEYISQDRFQYYQPGFAAFRVNGLKNPLFKPVVLMNRTELAELNQIFKELARVVTGTSPAERRQKFREAWLRLLSNHLGESNIERLANMTLEEVGNILYGTGGLPLGSEMLMDKNIECIIDLACTSDREFNAFVSDLYNNSVALENILMNDNDPRKFQSSGFVYYWLDFDILP
jgi:hypothetical protein